MTRKRVLLLASVLLGIIVTVLLVNHSRGPVIHGERLAYWVTFPEDRRADAELAVKEAGAAAVPFLLDLLDTQPAPEWVQKLGSTINRASWVPDWVNLPEDEPYLQWGMAARGFELLNTQALSALPALSNRLIRAWSLNQHAVAASLVAIGPEGLDVVLHAITNQVVTNKSVLIGSLPRRSEVRDRARPIVQPFMSDPDRVTAITATWVFLGTNPPLDELRMALNHSNPAVPFAALVSASRLSTGAVEVAPYVSNLLHSMDFRTRRTATNVLKRISPEAAHAAGVNTNPVVPTPRGRRRAGTNP